MAKRARLQMCVLSPPKRNLADWRPIFAKTTYVYVVSFPNRSQYGHSLAQRQRFKVEESGGQILKELHLF